MLSLEEIQVRAAAELELRSRRARFSRYATDPIGFIETELGFKLTDQQKAIALSVRDKRETNVQASHGVGKTMFSACCVIWFVLCVGGLAITTAPTKRQVQELLWGEIRKIHGRRKLPGDRGQTFLRITEEARGYGFTASDTNSNAFQGVHAELLLIVQDEACGISNDIDEGASSCATGSKNRILRVGNPIASGGAFEKNCKRSHLRIPVWDHPNVKWAYELDQGSGVYRLKSEVKAAICDPETGEVLPEEQWADWCERSSIPGAVSIFWIEEARAKYGEGSAYWQARVEGFFPEDAASSVIPRRLFLAARARYDSDPDYWNKLAANQPWRHGLDVGDGGDPHALASWRGPVLYGVNKMTTKGDMEDVSRAAQWGFDTLKTKPGTIGVDKIGVGAGALSELRGKLDYADDAFGINFGNAALIEPEEDSDETFIAENLKIELYWSLREALRKGEAAIAPLGEFEEELMDDLAGTFYGETPKGKTKIEDKKKTRKRLHRSPDCGDAAIYAWSQPPAIGQWGTSEAGWSY